MLPRGHWFLLRATKPVIHPKRGLRPPLTRSPQRPPTGAQRGQAQRLLDSRGAQDRTNYEITITESLRFQGIADPFRFCQADASQCWMGG